MQCIGLYLYVVGLLAGAASASPITFTESVNATGKVGATSFTNVLVTVTLNADTTNVMNPLAGIFSNVALPPVTVNIAGVGTAIFSDKMEAVVNQNLGKGGVSDLTTNFLTLFTINRAIFSSYNLGSAITIVGTPQINSSIAFTTNLGSLLLTATSGDSTFVASTSVPEPSNVTLVGLGLGLVGVSLGMFRRSASWSWR